MASKKELKALITLAGKVDPSLAKALSTASGGAKKTESAFSKVAQIAKGVFLGNLMTKGVQLISRGINEVSTKGIELASSLIEVQNVVDTTFGQSSKQIDAWSKTALKAYGLSELQAKQFNGTMGAMLKSSGLSSKYIVEMSQNLSGLAGDMASFYNLSQEDAFDKIRAGISGETEPLKQLGINMSVANLQAYALSKGIKTSYDKMDQASQTALRYSYLMNISKDAQGDFAKTLDTSYANQKRLLQTNFQEKLAQLATSVLPALTQWMVKLNTYLTNIDMAGVANKAVIAFNTLGNVVKFVCDNSDVLIPLLLGTVAAFAAFNIIYPIVQAYKIWAATQEAATVAQWAMNLAMDACPVLLIAAGIGLLIAAGVALYKNWDVVKAKALDLWIGIKAAFEPVGGFFAGVWQGVKDGFRGLINFIIKGINLWIKLQLMPVNLLIKAVNKIPGVKIPEISFKIPELPAFANGGFANQTSIFGEAGPEAAIPIKYKNPRSLSLLNQTAKAIGADSQGKSGVTLIYSPNIYGGQSSQISSALQEDFERFKEWAETYFDGKGRESFA